MGERADETAPGDPVRPGIRAPGECPFNAVAEASKSSSAELTKCP